MKRARELVCVEFIKLYLTRFGNKSVLKTYIQKRLYK